MLRGVEAQYLSSMSKLRLRALNSQNISTFPMHTDLNIKTLQMSWKHFYIVLNSFLNFNNTKILFKQFKNKITNTNKSLFFHKNFFMSNILFNKKNNIYVYNKKKLTTVKIIKTNNSFFIQLSVFDFNKIILKSSKKKKPNKKNIYTY